MRSIVMTFLIASAVLMFGAEGSRATEVLQLVALGEVRFLYVVPSDRVVSPIYTDRIAFAARHFQTWLAERLNGHTFRLSTPTVRTIRSDKPARWFSSTERYTGYNAFYRNTLDELNRIGAGRLNDPQARYVVYVDADHACGQSGAGGSGVAVVSSNDLRGLSGERIIPACEKANGAEIPCRCRWIGGIGHEILHTLGLSHPDRSPACQNAQCRSEALMMQGYITYPSASLLDDEKSILTRSPFIIQRSSERLIDCRLP